MRRKKLWIFAVCMVTLAAISLFIWTRMDPQLPQRYERNITRNIDSPEEENALKTAENINYSAILSRDRFDGSTDPEAYLHPGTYLEYTFANFIDSTTLDYYEARYEGLQGKGHPRQIEMNYTANVYAWPEFRFFNSPEPENVTWHNTTVVYSAPDGSVLLKNSGFGLEWGLNFFYKNQSDYQKLQPGFDLNFSDCYVVEVSLLYNEGYNPVAAFFSDVYQIVVLDRNFEPVLVGVGAGKAVA